MCRCISVKQFSFVRAKSFVPFGMSFFLLLCVLGKLPARASVSEVNIQTPALSAKGTTDVSSPIHFAATAESDANITGFVIYLDGQNIYQSHVPSLDAWVLVSPGSSHSVYIRAWDSTGSNKSSETYSIRATKVAPPTPPVSATVVAEIDNMTDWQVDNNNGVGGQCNTGSIGTFDNDYDPRTANSPDYDHEGQLFVVTSKCEYDDSLFLWKDEGDPQSSHTNFLWDFWFYIPTTTKNSTIQALEFDLFQAVAMSNGVHEFMFGSQCNYGTNQWQLWLPNNGSLHWVNAGFSPCQFSNGQWHHATYFYQRVTTSGYQDIPSQFDSSTDTNSDLRFGTLSIDGNTMYLGDLSYSTIPNPKWSPVFGMQHQLDSSADGVTIEEYVDEESLTAW
jgi:hypothetical protein